ncbi:MAG: type IV pilus modification protein PilV [Pseudomonadota bacterium]
MVSGTINGMRGFSLIEVLVAVLVLSIGLLGLAGLQKTSISNTHSSYLRSQANYLIYDLIDRMRANRATAKTGSYNIPFDTAPNGTTNCETAICSAADMAVFDRNQWKCLLGKWNANSVCNTTLSIVGRLPDGDGEIAQNGDVFSVRVRWIDRDGQSLTLEVNTEL